MLKRHWIAIRGASILYLATMEAPMTGAANRKAFAHGPDPRLFPQITRRFFLARTGNTLGGLFVSIALAGPAAAAQIASDDPRLRTERFEVVGMTTWLDMVADTRTALLWLKSDERSSKSIGSVGFGLGGTAINHAATKLPDLKAAAIFYGHPPPLADVGSIRASLLLNFAGRADTTLRPNRALSRP